MTSAIDSHFSLTFARAHGEPTCSAGFRTFPEDFYVEERLGFALTGDGEHACFYLEKVSQNTHWVAAQLAQHYKINSYDVSYCGRKDRHAVTRQWFSLYDPHQQVSLENFPHIEGVKLLDATRHYKKLRPGDHQSNRFVIRLDNVRDIDGNYLSQQAQVLFQTRALQIIKQGVPNYFGRQRFGRDGNNLQMAQRWFVEGRMPPRQQKGMVLSAARAYLFNCVLAERVRHNNWHQCLPGDYCFGGDGFSGDCFENQIPTGPLWGRGRLPTSEHVLAIEQQIQEKHLQWCERLEHQGLKQERRVLVLSPENYHCSWQDQHCTLAFELPVGAFATAVLSELVMLESRL